MRFRVDFFIQKELIEGGEVFIEALDAEWALQVLYLMLNTKSGIPSIYDSYSEPTAVEG